MAHPSLTADPETPPVAPTPPREVLTGLVRTATAAAGEQLTAMTNRFVASMLDMTTAGLDAAAAYRRTKAGNLLKNNSYAFVHLAGEAIERALRAELDALYPRKGASADLASLSLVPMEVMDSQVAFGTLCRPFEIAHSEVLASLCVRIGLLLGRDVLRPGQNPFRPEVFLSAVHDAWRAFEPDTESHPLLLPLLRPELFLELGPMLDTLDAALRAHGQRARERFHIRKSGEGAGRARRAGMDAALAQQLRSLLGDADAAPLVPDLPHMPQGQGWRPSAAAGFAVPAGSAPLPGTAPATAPGTAPGDTANPSAAAAQAPMETARAVSGFPARPVSAGTPPVAGVGPVQGGAGAIPAAMSGQPDQPGASLLGLLASLPAAQAGALPAAIGDAETSGPAALAHNVFYLPRLKQSLPQGSLSRGEEHTLDLLSRVFETVLLDESIPHETRELIRFLQVPVLKAALRDQNFFFEEAHPARRMIDLLSTVGWERRTGEADPVLRAVRRGVDRIRTEGEDGAQPQAFAAAVAELEAELAAEERAAEEAIAAPIARATKIERQGAAARSARQAIAVRVADGELVAVVSRFLEQRWVDVLTFAWLIEDERPGAVDNATRAMDELVWTVKPKATQEQRRALIARLPGLLTTLNKWLDAIKWQDAERLQFFAELAKCHLSIVRAPLELSPERQLELAVEAARQDALRRIANEQAAETGTEDAAAPSPVDDLERGMRLEFRQPDGSARKVKLAWVSPLRTLFIFSAGSGREAFSLPAEKLAQAFDSGSVRVVALEGVVGRVLLDTLQAMNDPAQAPLHAAG